MRISVLLVILFASSGAFAQEKWGEAGGWDIYVSAQMDRSCFAKRLMDDGSEVHIGFDVAHEGGFLAVYNPEWSHIKEGQSSVVEFDFGDARFAGEANAQFLEDTPGGRALFNNPAFVQAFARKNTVQVKGSQGVTFEIVLKGTQKAVTALRKCQIVQSGGGDKNK